MEQPYVLCSEEPSQAHDEDELIFVGVEHGRDDPELIFVGASSSSKPANSNILNRVTPGSRLKRKRNCLTTAAPPRQQRAGPAAPSSDAVIVLPESPTESRSTDSPIIIDPLSEPDCRSNSPQIVPESSSEGSPLVITSSSKPRPVRAAPSAGDLNESPYVSKCHSSAVNVINPQRPEIIEIEEDHSSALSPSGTFHTLSPQPSPCSRDVPRSLNHVVNGAPLPVLRISPSNVHPHQEKGPAGVGFSSLVGLETLDPRKGSLTLLLSDFYYGQHRGDGQPEQKTHTTFKCPECLKALKNVKFMNHAKHHLELERQGNDGWETHTTCQHCHRQFPSPFQLECHVDRVHTAPDPTTVCRICDLSFETDHVLLQHMKDNHKPGEMPYVCQICNYRSSAFADVETHFRKCHVNTKNLLCPFCLKIFKTATPYMSHYRGHWERSGHQCSKCRLQFLTFKEKMEHKTWCHQTFKKPQQLEGLPPDTKVVIKVSTEPVQSESGKSGKVASITVSTTDWEPSSPRSQGRPSKRPH
ncbi:zinc finger protein 280B-like [Chionomys nivalis]|uniref:zinc finger protein 280B-like n=1 Tax=Chionomys nivalis TaxID=269649 RepID=UPI00259A32DA|nr:zinc finger protein 280B-like [Chionomys nivalis]XP_057607409.1 zinc finger protein 280B-like [Chionomys nivalis]XP_057607410.1 zinc finger protein 280B-like [Chionomys nivalis]